MANTYYEFEGRIYETLAAAEAAKKMAGYCAKIVNIETEKNWDEFSDAFETCRETESIIDSIEWAR